jgi:septum formation topological specificity factor MinE
VNVDPEAVHINLDRAQGHEVLELSVALPEQAAGLARGATR